MTLLAIVGPTASGKTRAAVHLAKRFNADIVGADASQVYRHMDIGTGKASNQELDGVTHHMLDLVDPDQHFDAAEYAQKARIEIDRILASGRRVILCGGTGLYLRALLFGLCEAPAVAPEHRQSIQERIIKGDLPALYEELRSLDPATAARVSPNDKQRIERALGVFKSTGKPLSEWQAEQKEHPPIYPVEWIGFRWERDVLWGRIEKRIEHMLANGWVDEVRSLVEQGYDAELNSLGALGYRYILAHLQGRLAYEEMKYRTLVATRRYAKRQMTWFKANESVRWFEGPVDLKKLEAYVASLWTSEKD